MAVTCKQKKYENATTTPSEIEDLKKEKEPAKSLAHQ